MGRLGRLREHRRWGCISTERKWLLQEGQAPGPQASNTPPLPWGHTTALTGHPAVRLDLTEQMSKIPVPWEQTSPRLTALTPAGGVLCARNCGEGALLAFLVLSFPLEILTPVGCWVRSGYGSYYCNQPASIKIYVRGASDRLK